MNRILRLSKFDAELNADICDLRTNAELTIHLKLGFRQINPAGGAATGTFHDFGDPSDPHIRRIIKWTPGVWTAWKANLVSAAQRHWNGKFWLINHRGILPTKSGEAIYVPNVWCRFKLTGTDSTIGTHHVIIDVVRLDPSEPWFGSTSRLYDSKDTDSIEKGRTHRGRKIMQRGTVHEIGHLLGFEHVDAKAAACLATHNPNDHVCYGTKDSHMYDVMGCGEKLYERHAAPWLRALSSFLPLIPPSPLYTPPPRCVSHFDAAMVRHYPRTVKEFEAGTLVTSR
ncbi:hypothetical protein PQR34_42520 [Paraburkholderia sediminicola]|uniref:hypothetical protein n=1 Tax=Paraburkholderia sediminicola TaxID=458836 RepID=UPI0038B8D26D